MAREARPSLTLGVEIASPACTGQACCAPPKKMGFGQQSQNSSKCRTDRDLQRNASLGPFSSRHQPRSGLATRNDMRLIHASHEVVIHFDSPAWWKDREDATLAGWARRVGVVASVTCRVGERRPRWPSHRPETCGSDAMGLRCSRVRTTRWFRRSTCKNTR